MWPILEVLLCVACAAPFVIPVGVRWDKIRARRALDRAVSIAIANAADGKKTCLRGVVELDRDAEPLISPLSQLPCVYWEIAADEGGGSDWTSHGSRQRACAFLISDDSGAARIAADTPLVLAPPHRYLRVPVYDAGKPEDLRSPPGTLGAAVRPAPTPTSDLGRSLAAFGGKLDLVTYGTLRFTEYVITSGMPITVLAGCTREPDPGAVEAVSGYREQLPSRPVLSGTRRAPLIIRVDKAA